MDTMKRVLRLKSLLQRLSAGNDIQTRDLQNALTESEFKEYKWACEVGNNWTSQQKPPVIKTYQRLRGEAMRKYSIYQKHCSKRHKKNTPVIWDGDRQHEYDRALSRLQEHYFESKEYSASDFRIWVGQWKPLDSKDTITAHEDPAVFPKVFTPREAEKKAVFGWVMNRRDIKQFILEASLAALEQPDEVFDISQLRLNSRSKNTIDHDYSKWKF